VVVVVISSLTNRRSTGDQLKEIEVEIDNFLSRMENQYVDFDGITFSRKLLEVRILCMYVCILLVEYMAVFKVLVVIYIFLKIMFFGLG
jgi:hypothetical protein